MHRHLGGDGEPVLLLHGLAGHAGEWAETAAWLSRERAVFALEGEGGADAAAAAVAAIGTGAVVCVGQSLGGRVAIELAAERPELVRALVVAEAEPGGGPEVAAAVAARLGASLGRWPESFASRAEAIEYLGGPGPRAETWAAGLLERDGRLWPWFDREAAVERLRAELARSLWDEWERIAGPTLIVRGEHGELGEATAAEMAARLPGARVVTIPGAGHEVHLDRPRAWRAGLEPFLAAV